MRDIFELYDALDALVGTGEGVARPDDLAAARGALALLRRRGATVGSTLLVALSGGTGSGKSSLLNAIAGEPVASVSRLRPHTEQPLAWLPEDADSGVRHLLADLGVNATKTHSRLPGMVLIDLPDMDSVAAEHRRSVEHLLGSVDAVLWVLDPQKYNDPALHEDFLAPLARYCDQSAFVLNKIDRLETEEISPVVASVREALIARGYPDAAIFPLAADPDGHPPQAVEPLVAYLSDQLDRKKVAYGKLLADIAGAVRGIGVAAGVWEGAATGLGERWNTTRELALAALQPDALVPGEDALCRVEDLIAATAAEVGGPVADGLRGRLDTKEVEDVLAAAQRAVAAGELAAARNEMDERIGIPMADVLEQRSRFAALVALTHIGARQIGHRYGVTVR